MRFELLRNFRVKLTAFIVAILFWFAVVTESDYQYDIDVPIQPVNVPSEKIIVNDLPETARVRFEGRGKALLALRFNKKARIEINLDNIKARAAVPLDESMLLISRRSHGINVFQVLYPDTVRIELAPLQRRLVPIYARIQAKPADGFTVVGGVQLQPDSAWVSGPAHHVARLDSLYTEPLRFTDIRSGLSGRVRVEHVSDSLKIRIPLNEVTYSCDVQKLLEFQIEEVPVEVRNLPRNLKATPRPSTASITVVGGERLLMGLTRDDFKVYIDYTKGKENHAAGYAPEIQMPPEVHVSRIVPPLIKLEIERQ